MGNKSDESEGANESQSENSAEFNYTILLALNRLEGDPGLYFPNNNYTTPIPVNFYLAGLNIKFPIDKNCF